MRPDFSICLLHSTRCSSARRSSSAVGFGGVDVVRGILCPLAATAVSHFTVKGLSSALLWTGISGSTHPRQLSCFQQLTFLSTVNGGSCSVFTAKSVAKLRARVERWWTVCCFLPIRRGSRPGTE